MDVGKDKRKRRREKKGKRLFGAVILALMTMLTVGVVAFAKGGVWEAEGSYSLLIEKKFDEDILPKVKEAAEKMEYTFQVTGTRMQRKPDGGYDEIPVDTEVTINKDTGWKYELTSSGPFNVTVTEITNNMTLTVDGTDYNMGDSYAEATTLFRESPQIRELNSNGKISLSRPEKKIVDDKEVSVTTTSSFRVRNEWPWGDEYKPENWQSFDKTVELTPGGIGYDWTGLSAGRYTIEDLSVPGYTLQVGPRENVQVAPGETGRFYINCKLGKLTITAGGQENDGEKHYFVIDRVKAPDSAEPFVKRTTECVLSGETCPVDNLPQGEYAVTEYSFSDAPTAFEVKVPETEKKDRGETFKKSYIKDTESYTRFSVGGDYITDLKFGPLRNASNNPIKNDFTYNFGIRYRKAADQEGYTTTAWRSNTRKANTIYSFTSPIYPRADKTLAFAVWNVTATTGDHVDLSWTECTRKNVTYSPKDTKKDYKYTVDERGWMEITAPTIPSDTIGMEDVSYIYTLREEKDGSPIRTLTLRPGDTERIEDLDAGSYFLMEEVSIDEPKGFTMDVSGSPFGTTEAGHVFEITVKGDRTLTITKPGSVDVNGSRDYTFQIEPVGDSTFTTEEVTLKAGGTIEVGTLPAGTYKVKPLDDEPEVFELTCSDTSQVNAAVPSSSAATMTFTNVFTTGSYGYRYVHEYYLKKDGRYIYEGNSPVTTIGGRSDPKETYNSIDVTKELNYIFTDKDGNEHVNFYTHMPDKDAYGKVVTDDHDHIEDEEGIRQCGSSNEKGGTATIRYHVDNELTAQKYIGVNAAKDQVIILRYFRELPEDQTGSYKYVHVYYLRDKDGDHWEGTSEITDVPGQLGMQFTAEKIQKKPRYRPNDSSQTYMYTYDERPNYGTLLKVGEPVAGSVHIDQDSSTPDSFNGSGHRYRPNSDGTYVTATQDGMEIIILRYYRSAYYHVVHEYYVRTRGDEGIELTSLLDEELDEEMEEEIEEEEAPEKIEHTEESEEAETPGIQKESSEQETADHQAESSGQETVDAQDPSGETEPDEERPSDEQESSGMEESSAQETSGQEPSGAEDPDEKEPSSGEDPSVQETPGPEESGGQESSDMEEAGSQEPSAPAGSGAQRPSGENGSSQQEPPVQQENDAGLKADPKIASLAVSMMRFSMRTGLELEAVSDTFKIPMASGLADEATDGIDDGADAVLDDMSISDHEDDNAGASEDESSDGGASARPADTDSDPKTVDEEDDHGALLGDEDREIGTSSNARRKPSGSKRVSSRVGEEAGSEVTDDSEEIGGEDSSDESGWIYTYEGRSEILSINAPENSEHYTYDIELQTRYHSRDYEHDTDQLKDGYGNISSENEQEYVEDESKTVAIATQNGDQIIILRYYRDASAPDGPGDPDDPDESDDPEKPDETDPTPPPPGGGGGRHHRDPDPDPTPSSTTAPDPTSEQPTETMGENPGYPTELPDPNDPNSPARITIWEDGVPKTYVKVWNPETGMWEYILEEEVPLSWQDLPQTGDKSRNVLWMVLFISSIVGIIWLIAVRRKERS